jgi:hypothetical protein
MEGHMTVAAQLAALRQLTDLMLDQRLLDLRKAQQAQQETRGLIAALDQISQAADCALPAAARAELLYQSWAEARRKDLNLTLARQSVTEIEARAAASVAFGKQRVVSGLQQRAQDKPLKR